MALEEFYHKEPCLEDYWRGIVLFGRNVATYKFALAKSLLDLKPCSGQLLKIEELAPVFAGHIAEHIKLADKQATSSSSKFLDACRQFNLDQDHNKLVYSAIRLGFNNVIDAFHIVGSGEIPRRFFIDERKSLNGIRITDEFSKLVSGIQTESLHQEVESRWRLVETAWEMGVATNLVRVDHDAVEKELFTIDRTLRRKTITSSRAALNGYQKGKCFYCFKDISVGHQNNNVEVDHFFPHTLKQSGFGSILDGVWNLVLSCTDCNRGTKGKFASTPSIKLLYRLSRRNEFLIASHHPLRETLMQQTGVTISQRITFLNDFYQSSRKILIHVWEDRQNGPEYF